MKPTGVDVFGFTVAALSALFAVVNVTVLQPAFVQMFEDFGGALPWLTRLMLKPPVPLVLGLVPFGIVVSRVGERSVRVVAASVFAVAQVFVSVLALYLPVWSLAGKIQ